MTGRRAPHRFGAGTAGFTVVLAMATAGTALAIDTVLPAFPDIRADLALAPDSTDVAALVTAFLFGQGLGLLPAGLLADRYGRRAVLWGGLGIYVVAAVVTAVAPDLEVMIAARVVWGLGAAGPRVAAMAMVRDAFEGEAMARQMSLIMAVFLIVPAVAPAIGAALIEVAPWQSVIWVCVLFAAGVLVSSFGLPATMPAHNRRQLRVADVVDGLRTVIVTPGTAGYLLAMTALFASFISYLASSEIIIGDLFDLREWFPLVFASVAAVMAVAMVVNVRIVEAVGLDRLLNRTLVGLLVTSAGLLGVSIANQGRPSFALFYVSVLLVIVCQQILVPNINAAAMRPLGEVAGLASALLGMVPMVGGSLLGSVIDRAYDGTITPLSVGFFTAAWVAAAGLTWAHRSRSRSAAIGYEVA